MEEGGWKKGEKVGVRGADGYYIILIKPGGIGMLVKGGGWMRWWGVREALRWGVGVQMGTI